MNNNNGGGIMLGYALIAMLQVMTLTLLAVWILSASQYRLTLEARQSINQSDSSIEQVIEQIDNKVDPLKREFE